MSEKEKEPAESSDSSHLPQDPRIDWLLNRVVSSTKMKMTSVIKLKHEDSARKAMLDFFDSSDKRTLFIYQGAKADELCCGTFAPAPSLLKKKSLYFCKDNGVSKVTEATMRKVITEGEFGHVPLQALLDVAQEVYFPILTNGKNQEGWPEVISKEVTENLHKFLANLYVTIGHTKGRTLLPLPPSEPSTTIEKAARDKDRVHVLESAVVMWTRQIKNVLKMDPEALLKAGQNSGPQVELEFWYNKAQNLNSIHEQLSGERVRKVIKVLEVTKSTYFPAFNRLCKEVAQARMEANDNIVYLRPLERFFASLGQEAFPELIPLFKPIMHTILLTWKHSKFYNTPARLVVLMREICNDLICQACKFVSGESLFTVEPQEAVDNLKLCLKVCVTFKSTYFDYKARAGTECPSNPWRFQNSALFARLDSFLERCHDVLDLMQTILQFNKLERVEIGGTKGKTLTNSVRQIFQEFFDAVAAFQHAPYDIMDVEAKQFDDDFYEFRGQINELERRLASVITQAFDDSTTVLGRFKLLDSFEGLLEREIIQTDLEKKNTDLLNAFALDLKQVQEIFLFRKENPPVNDNMPPRAGAVAWVRGLVERVEDPMNRLKGMGKSVLESEEGKEATRAYNAIMTSLQEYERQHVEEWSREIENTSQEKLKQSLLRRDDDSPYLRVNFDPALVCLLREVKYFLLLKIEVPESAMQIFKKAETFRQQTGNLELIVNIYNHMLSTLLEVERPLVQTKLDNIDKVLQKGLKHLNWKSHSISDFIQQTMSIVKDASTVLSTIKKNVADTQFILKNWRRPEALLFDRKSVKTYSLDEFQAMHVAKVTERYNDVRDGEEKIQQHLAGSNKVLKVSKGASSWRAYVDYVNQIYIDGLVDAVLSSVQYLRNQLDSAYLIANDVNPLLEIKLELVPPDIAFSPEMGQTAKRDGVRDIVSDWVNSVLNISTLTKRLDTGDGDYLNDIQDDIDVKFAVADITRLVTETEQQCHEFKESYSTFSYLWQEQMQVKFKEFLTSDLEDGKTEPPLSRFDAEIARFKALEEKIKELPASKIIGWLKVDAKPIKNALHFWVSKWSYMYKEYLTNKVSHTVLDLMSFIDKNNASLDKEIEGDDQATLLEVMGSMRDVRVRTELTDEMFEPLRKTVELLRKYGVTTSDDVLEQLEQAPLLWNNLKKKTIMTKEKHSQTQSDEADKLKRKVKMFDDRVTEFAAQFRKNMPLVFSENFQAAYQIIDKYHHGAKTEEMAVGSLVELQTEASRLNELQELFELNVTEYKEIKTCLQECAGLKHVWDMISIVVNTYDEWKKTRWNAINVDFLTEENKRLFKEVRGMHKSIKNFNAYKGLEDTVKNMQVTLPLVSDLHHPAMRERHWKQLMRAMGVSFTMDDGFSLGDLLALKPHEFVDDVAEIVDRAQKELIIEKQLKRIDETWVGLTLSFVPFEEGDLMVMETPEAVIEALEENQVQLQNMQASKYVQNNPVFLEEVGRWQRKLGMVESVISAWMEVQKKWSNLQSIFVGSADIRVQLPEDSKRFDGVDAEWKELMKEAQFNLNVIESCNMEGRLERIEAMLEGLEKCEKALADYLETKRSAYPRFYFVAAADLLDILSKGSNPQLIMKHLPKCFDNIRTLEFTKDKEGLATKSSVGMVSGEGEYVGFPQPFICEGAVELWLKDLTAWTHDVIRVILSEAVRAYEEKPRQEFLLDWPAQITVLTFRIVYTEEVNYAFDQLEEGNENALKDYNKKQIENLTMLTDMIMTDLTSNDRKKIITIVTVDVHNRDVVAKLVDIKAESSQCFEWVSQLRYCIDEKTDICRINLSDFERNYGYEYIGNCGCLVITPLTDRCYITLCQAQRLIMGAAPAGPAGTGKTETVKDLGRSTGNMVYVFNCSDQMDYKSMGQIFKGLAQAGAWGCFDEFNRIDISVLSVVSTQLKCVIDGIRGKKDRFLFEEDEISLCLDPLCFSNITMNPGYAGRTELPESVKALFRPCAMIVPDMDLISEIMLMSEGFSEGKILAKKFMILYRLNESLLSAQKHYDWKLRAVKTTLNVAGGMRRQDKDLSEDKVLLRALRDFNLGKLVADDVGIFMGLLNDLFPKTLELVPRKRDATFEDIIRRAARELGIQPEEVFNLKVSQLRELLDVRWSVFVLGPAGCGKSCIIKTLAKAQNMANEKTTTHVLNPKAVTRNELYGYIHASTREWKDGLVSQIFRDLANITTVPHEYIVLDGDIDPEWIESMNTVMDDNKMLTLASNERIPLTPPMRLLFEIENLREASPATVSRAGIIYMNDTDVGWTPFVSSWIERRELESERSQLTKLFEAYILKSLDFIKKNMRTVVPLPEINLVKTVCYVLEGLLGTGEALQAAQKALGPEEGPKLLEALFVFCCVWGMGGSLTVEQGMDYRLGFSKWWADEWKVVRFPDGGSVFDFVVDPDTGKFLHWDTKVPSYQYNPDTLFGNIFIDTVETVRLMFLLDQLMTKRRLCMFVGAAGTGKTTIMKDKLRNLDPETAQFLNINLNCMTDSLALQTAMEASLEKKTGRVYGPLGSRKLVYFIDDLNMPQVDIYGTQEPLALLRQLVDYGSWYDRGKLTLKEIQNVQYVSCLNPTAGSFTVDPRLQTHYCTFGVQMPSPENMSVIYQSILTGHLQNFNPDIQKLNDRIIKATFDLFRNVWNTFLPTAIKFHYQFNLREVSSVFEGLCRAQAEYFSAPLQFTRLWVHECERVFSDRLVTEQDLVRFGEMLADTVKKFFDDQDAEKVNARPLVFASFVTPQENPPYIGISDAAKLKKLLDDKLTEYNESNAVMNLVLFEQAIEHVCRITRVIFQPRGNALLVGVGGSGKQSLAKLSAFICGYEVFQITVTATYNLMDFKVDLMSLYTKAGIKSIGTCFVMTDGQIVDERFLVYINDMLATGNVPDLFTNEEKDEVCNGVRSEMKQLGLVDTRDNCWEFFIEKTRRYLHTILCFSPVGDKFRIRARQFPALTSATSIDWFHPWPQDALVAVGTRFLLEVGDIAPEVKEQLANHMAFVHSVVNEKSVEYLESERRYNYTTPKSFLDLIDLYKDLLEKKRSGIHKLKSRLENGLEKLRSASDQVTDLQASLKVEIEVVEEKKSATEQLLVQVGQETAIAEEQKAVATIEEDKSAKQAEEVNGIQDECKRDLAAAEPLVIEAEAALNGLDKKHFTEMKALATPPPEVADVLSAVMILVAPRGVIPKDISWNAAKKAMASVDKFLKDLLVYDKDNVPENCCAMVEKLFIIKPYFNKETMVSKSAAAAGLCAWVVNICKYFRIYQMVEPKRQKLADANSRLEEANKALSAVRAKVADLEARLAKLTGQFEQATADKNAAIQQMERTLQRANLAERLVNGLADENVRWANSLDQFAIQERNLVGDVVMASAFVSYIGAFNARFRTTMVADKWIPDIIERQIPMTEGMLPLEVLTDDAEIASWCNEGLPSDSVSVQNGAIICNCKRWPLMIDPQLQGIKWITRREESHGLRTVQQTTNRYLDQVELAITNGEAIMLENCPESIDAVLEPVLSRSVIRRGRSQLIKLGDKEVEYDPNFALFLQTKLSNPHYKPEVAAQTTLINFMITQDGLEEQLLALVVNKERPDLEEKKQELLVQQNEFKIKLKQLEDDLLFRLSSSEGDILADVELIEGLEITKATSKEIHEKVELAKETEKGIQVAREVYRPVGIRGALLYFLMDSLWILDHMYRYSMANFVTILAKGMDKADDIDETDEAAVAAHADIKADPKKRVESLIDHSCFVSYSYVTQGLFERHKLIYATQLCMRILARDGVLDNDLFDFLIRGPKASGSDNPLAEWLSDSAWSSVQALHEFEMFENLPTDIETSAKRFREWYEFDRPEDHPLPGDLKKLSPFHRLCVIRCLRPDRVSDALATFIRKSLGDKYMRSQPFDLIKSYDDSSSTTPMFFILSAGVDPVKDVEAYGKKLGFSYESGKFSLVSLGQGQEPVAEKSLESNHRNGGWTFLMNIHLTPRWTGGYLEKKLDKIADGAHTDFRLFLSSEPSAGMPVNILQVCIKMTNEPPEGLMENHKKAWLPFSDEFFENCTKPAEAKSIVFALSFFHAILIERKKFGAQGWNRVYPFNIGDLLSCAQVTLNYLDNNPKIPWDDLIYIFGEIMYGGHITDDWDRKLCLTYLKTYMNEELIEGTELFAGFPTPASSMTCKQLWEYIEVAMPPEAPVAYGMHSNAEIGFRLLQADTIFKSILDLQPRGAGGGGGMSLQDKAKYVLDDIMDKMPELFDMIEILERVEERTPFNNVFLQELERMNGLVKEMRRSLAELDLGLKGDLQISDPMEQLMGSLFFDQIPARWQALAYPSLRTLSLWLFNLLERHKQLVDWTAEMGLPKVTTLSFLFSPQAFLTAVMQTTARKNDWPLDKTVIQTDVTKKSVEDIAAVSRDGAFITGLVLEGARWDDKGGNLEDSKPKELFAPLPVMQVKAITADKAENRDAYACPVYKTQNRGPTFVFTAHLRTKSPVSKWVLCGVAMLMDVV
mmetsp:Transcript_13737/g.31794  ORF Transcript_13737/g.31794 Transcript_13737/m.31794 type:complete len:4493 (-) Transcript_13737:49-13527(-)|eukprot:CAMPEP_0114552430 /NCGR_PEP_ID=MMETSP0114-20121206/7120_1 /TAXON_ID=31324 /ORGANISM="Goniomonas sp, Strain m" /LENGTH=4492 /DNA_ID=CAMNT_0001737305 /DNA_START=126 /DNA_END=13604 /DNA_ORIENTATION=+